MERCSQTQLLNLFLQRVHCDVEKKTLNSSCKVKFKEGCVQTTLKICILHEIFKDPPFIRVDFRLGTVKKALLLIHLSPTFSKHVRIEPLSVGDMPQWVKPI